MYAMQAIVFKQIESLASAMRPFCWRERNMMGRDVSNWPVTSFTALQKCSRYRINSGQTAPSGMTVSAAFDPMRTSLEVPH
jgi:hypothetical protein